jgi:hypothetical protein
MVSQNTLKASLNFMVIEIYPDRDAIELFRRFCFSQLRKPQKTAIGNPCVRYIRQQTEGFHGIAG